MIALAEALSIGAQLLQAAPSLEAAVSADLAAFDGSTMTAADLLVKWKAMQTGYLAAEALYKAAPGPGTP